MTTNNQAGGQEEIKVSIYSVIVVILCVLSWGASFISRNVWSSAIASASTLAKLGITAIQAGGIATAFYIGYVASNFFSGFLIDSIGAKKSLAITALGTGIATLFIPMCNGYWMIFLLRVLAGIFAGPLFSSITKFNFAYFPDRLRAVITGIMGVGPAVGSAIASIAFTPMVAAKGYQTAFIWAGATTLIVGIVVWVILKDRGVTKPMKDMESLSEEEKKKSTQNALKVFMRRDFLIGSVTHFFFMCASTGLMTWMLAYLINEKGMQPATAGLVFGSAQLLGLISGTLGGICSDLLKTRKWVMVVLCPLIAILLNIFTSFNSVGALTVCYMGIYLFQGMAGTNSNTMQAERAKGPYTGKVMGWYNAVCQLGSVVMPIILGAVLQYTGKYRLVIVAISSVFVINMILGLIVKDTYVKKEKAPKQA